MKRNPCSVSARVKQDEEMGWNILLLRMRVQSKLRLFQKIVRSKDQTLHYLPYNFFPSEFEKKVLKKILTLSDFGRTELEDLLQRRARSDTIPDRLFCRERKTVDGTALHARFSIRGGKKRVTFLIRNKGSRLRTDPAFYKKKALCLFGISSAE